MATEGITVDDFSCDDLANEDLFAITVLLSMSCGLGAKADQLNNTKSDKAIAKTKRFSIDFISKGHNLTCQKMGDNAIF
ncbi:MAG: hypothetical protein ACYDFR_02345 [Candidatus Omnitrophota bacterium]